MKYIKNPAHAITFVAMCDYIGVGIPLALSICKQESHFRQYVWSESGGRNGYVVARGYMGVHHLTALFIFKSTPGMVYKNERDEYDAANNFYCSLKHAKYCIDVFGISKGLEIYNVGDHNYLVHGWRNAKYVNSVLSNTYRFREELDNMVEFSYDPLEPPNFNKR